MADNATIKSTLLKGKIYPCGDSGTIEIGEVTTGAEGSDVEIINVGTRNHAILNITIPKGDTGLTGNGIAKIEKTGTAGLVDTYTITYTDGTTTTYTVTNANAGSAYTKTEADQLLDDKLDKTSLKNQIPSTIGTYDIPSMYLFDLAHKQLEQSKLRSSFTPLTLTENDPYIDFTHQSTNVITISNGIYLFNFPTISSSLASRTDQIRLACYNPDGTLGSYHTIDLNGHTLGELSNKKAIISYNTGYVYKVIYVEQEKVCINNNEKIIGTFFGKPLYEKTIEYSFTDTNNEGTLYSKMIDLGIDPAIVDKIWLDESNSFLYNPNGGAPLNINGRYSGSTNRFYRTIVYHNDNVSYQTGTLAYFSTDNVIIQTYKLYITVKYTKTTD